MNKKWLSSLLITTVLLASCSSGMIPPTQSTISGTPRVLAVESFLTDFAQNVSGDRIKIETLMPLGMDPHSFEPTPQDVARVAESQVLIINGAGLEAWIEKVLSNAGGQRTVVEASAGLTSRKSQAESTTATSDSHPEGDPHFWLDPTLAIKYVENIRDGLTSVDPAGKDIYASNAQAYIAKLKDLDAWIKSQVETIPPQRRLMVTNHESLGYFADRYGFQVIGAILPSVSTNASPSAQQMASLVDQIKSTHTPAIFLETGANPQLAEQLAAETGARVVTDLYTHSLSAPDGPAPTYLDMMRYNTTIIVKALS